MSLNHTYGMERRKRIPYEYSSIAARSHVLMIYSEVDKKQIYVDTIHFGKRVDLRSASLIVKNWVGYPVLYNTHASCMGGRRR